MKSYVAFVGAIALTLGSTAALAERDTGVPVNPVTGAPGNSTAARDLVTLPNGTAVDGQPNCLGDIVSTIRSSGPGPFEQHTGQDQANQVGTAFLIGSLIGVTGGGVLDCSEKILGQ